MLRWFRACKKLLIGSYLACRHLLNADDFRMLAIVDSSLDSARERPAWSFPLTPLRIAISREVVQPALRTALFVGTVLNLINQGDALFGAEQVAVGKMLVTYCVPYCVSTYTATRVMLRTLVKVGGM